MFDCWEPIPKEIEAFGGIDLLRKVLSPDVNVRPRDVTIAFMSQSGASYSKINEVIPNEELDAHEEFDIDRFEDQDTFLLKAYLPSEPKEESGMAHLQIVSEKSSFIPPMPQFCRK